MSTIIATPQTIEQQHFNERVVNFAFSNGTLTGATAEPAAAQVCPAMRPSGAFAVERKDAPYTALYRLETCQMSPSLVLQLLQQIPAKK